MSVYVSQCMCMNTCVHRLLLLSHITIPSAPSLGPKITPPHYTRAPRERYWCACCAPAPRGIKGHAPLHSPHNDTMGDSVYRTRSEGVPAKGLRDQYADGEAARVWELYIGCTGTRTSQYKEWLTALLHQHGCQSLLDVACGTG